MHNRMPPGVMDALLQGALHGDVSEDDGERRRVKLSEIQRFERESSEEMERNPIRIGAKRECE